MIKEIQDYLLKEAAKKKDEEAAYRRKILTDIGIGSTSREYGTNEPSEEYKEYDQLLEKYYKEVPIELTDEEWAEVKEVYENSKKSSNPVRNTAVTAAVIIYIFGLIGGISMLKESSSAFFGIAVMVSAFILGTILLSLAEIIKLLKK
jgi:hypothetical protein